MSNYFRKSRFSKAVAGFTGLLVAFTMIGGVGVNPANAQLTQSQIQSILNLLSSFGADQATMDNVEGALNGQPTSGGGSGSGSGTGGSCSYTFTQNLTTGSTGTEVMNLQKFLNMDPATQIASSGPGSPGNETSYFGSITKSGVVKFQNKYSAEVLAPVGLSSGTGYWGPSSRAHANVVCANMGGGNNNGGGNNGGNTGGLNVTSNGQPSNGLFVESASRVPFTTFTISNNSGSSATVNSVTVEKTGLINRNAFDGVLLMSGNTQLGDARSLNSNNQATVGSSVTIPAGGSKTFTVAANSPANLSARAGEVGGLNVVAINTSSSVSGSLPISGAAHTVNATLAIGSVTVDEGTNDPDVNRDKEIGTTDYTFSSVRIDAGSEEDVRLHSIRWTNNGSANLSDLSNLMVDVDGSEYSVTMDGDVVTADFGNGILIPEGNNVDVAIVGDITGSGANGDTVQFDIEETHDIYVVGETFNYGILPTAASTSGSSGDANSQFPTSGNPFFDGSKVTITGGSVSTISKSNSVPSQNVAINVNNQPLGAFTTNLLGEALEIDGITFGITTTGGDNASDLTNVTLVNENGSVVAGPVDGSATGGGANGKIEFSDLIEFPVGSHTYTLRGKLSTDFADGDTIKATTTVNTTYWTDPEGSNTGDAYTLPGNTVTMNTMTVKAGSLNVSVGSTPASQSIVAGAQDFTFANYIFDATGSGEDVRFSSVALYQTLGDATEISGCQLWDGSTALNRGGNVVNTPNIGSDTTFTFNDTFTIPKGTTKTVALKCDLASGASTNVQWGVNNSDIASVTGVQSGTAITESVSTSAGPTMTVSAAGTVTVAVDSSDPSEAWYVAGSEATVGVFELSGTNESFELTDLELQLDNASSSASDIAEIALYDGTTQLVRIPSPAFTNNNEHFSIDGFTVPQNDDANVTVKVKFGEIGVGKAGASGSLVRFATSTNAANNEARGTESGSTVTLQGNVGTTTGARYFNSLPTLADVSSANISGVLSNGTKELYRFTVSADSADDVGVKQFTFNVATTGATATSFKLTEVNTGKVVQSGVASDGSDNVTINVDNSTYGSQFITVAAGSSRTYKLEATVAGAATSGDTITTKLLQDSAYPSLASGELMGQAANLTGSNNFVWSPFSTTSSLTTNDWTNGFRVPGIEFDDLSDFSRSVN